MPNIGEIKRDIDIGGYSINFTKYIWVACVDCGKERWVHLVKRMPSNDRCGKCSKSRAYNTLWKGGRRISKKGYITIVLDPLDFFYSMAMGNGCVLEHRLVMAKHLGRNLHRWEIVHHKNHIKHDNRIENLQLVSDDRHTQITLLEQRIKHLEGRVTLLEAENTLLKMDGKSYRRK